MTVESNLDLNKNRCNLLISVIIREAKKSKAIRTGINPTQIPLKNIVISKSLPEAGKRVIKREAKKHQILKLN